jgi:hypothetical protein
MKTYEALIQDKNASEITCLKFLAHSESIKYLFKICGDNSLSKLF